MEPSVLRGDDGVGVGFLDEGLGVGVVFCDVGIDGGLQVADRAKEAAFQLPTGDLGGNALEGV